MYIYSNVFLDKLKDGDYCESDNVCEDGLICEDPKKPGKDVNSCAPKRCKCAKLGIHNKIYVLRLMLCRLNIFTILISSVT